MRATCLCTMPMTPMLLLFFFAFAFAMAMHAVAAEEPSQEITIEANALRIKAPAPTDDESMRAMNWAPGTTVGLLLRDPKGGLIQFDGKDSALSKFVDDKGTDLLEKPASFFGNIGFGMFRLSKDGKACVLELTSPTLPVKGCSHLKVAGLITMLCATQTKEQVQKAVPMVNGSKISIPNLELTIDRAGKPDWGEEPFGLTLRSSRELDDVAEVRFFKTDGTEIKSKRMGTSKMEILGARTVEWNYNLAERVDAATVKIFIWTDMQKKRVPFSLDVDVGL